ncbi:MAG TPA: 2-oxoacid:acceptor oxidoreductase family protein [Candidatus Lokiarchaeia archaeon]|nr:2-oxoacid:acceptor oxidoreductase family protein [Candidatus Lokiarchaeia archaeon]
MTLLEIVVHGRGGQGAVTAAQIIAEAAYQSGNFRDVNSFPSFGAERRGAPVQAYTRLSSTDKIYTRSQIIRPDIIIILDETVFPKEQIPNLKENGIIIVNSPKTPAELAAKFNIRQKCTIATADVSKICFKNKLVVDELPILNTPILGVLSKVLNEIPLETMKEAIIKHMENQKGSLNALAADYSAAVTQILDIE